MLDVVSAALNVVDHAHAVVAAIPNPGQGAKPPGADQLEKILKWVAWIVFGMCVAGVLIVAGRMAISHRRGEGGEHASGLAWVFAACILAGSASALVGALVGGGS
ncbi:hypothetical protein [Actinomadura napierensis]|uniref:Conjugal transfer protein TrbC n=1 Tax=Actinomadura napierensis TaxID=267854 RepID=A0ABN2ZWD8_9ACTN